MRGNQAGFTLLELVVVTLIIGVLVGIALPVYASTIDRSQQMTCFGNQRAVEGAAHAYAAERDLDASALEGVVTAGHPLASGHIFARPPHCPSAPIPVVLAAPEAAEGAYTLDDRGFVEPCGFGFHGRYTP